jgi:hypothetical protein
LRTSSTTPPAEARIRFYSRLSVELILAGPGASPLPPDVDAAIDAVLARSEARVRPA